MTTTPIKLDPKVKATIDAIKKAHAKAKGCEYDVENRDVFAAPAPAFEEIAYAFPA